jgi:large subunit ribosomal protein L30e
MATIETSKEIRRAVDTGKIQFGYNSTERNVLKGNGKLVILSANAPTKMSEKSRHIAKVSEIPVFDFNGTSKELGSVCGKPFVVSIMLVQDEGKSKVLDIIQETKKVTGKRKSK